MTYSRNITRLTLLVLITASAVCQSTGSGAPGGAGSGASGQPQVSVGGPTFPVAPTPQSVVLSPATQTVIAGNASVDITAILVLSDGQQNVNITNGCTYVSSSPSVATIPTSSLTLSIKAQAIAVGSTTITATCGTFLATAVVSVITTPQITAPNSLTCVVPCPITPGQINIVYPGFTFVGTPAGGTWAVTVGALPTGLSLNAGSGAVTGTPTGSPATTNFTIQYTNGSAVTLQVQIVTTSTCGPPSYNCSTLLQLSNTIAAIFDSHLSTGSTCTSSLTTNGGTNSCLNGIAYDTTTGNPVGVDPYTRVTDSGSSCGLAGDSMTPTTSGGANDFIWGVPFTDPGTSHNSYLLAVATNGAFQCVQVLDVVANAPAVKVVNQQPSKLILPGRSMSASRLLATRFYTVVSHSQLSQSDISLTAGCPDVGISCVTNTTLVDLSASGVCPGLPQPFTSLSNTLLSLTSDDDTFFLGMSNVTGGQGSALWQVTWSRTKGCSTFYVGSVQTINAVNYTAGEVWGFCKAPTVCGPSTAPLGNIASNVGCFGAPNTGGKGIHDTIGGLDSTNPWMMITTGGTWTAGACAGVSGTNEFSVWKAGTLLDQWCHGAATGISDNGCISHASIGIANILSFPFKGANTRSVNDVTSFTYITAQLPGLKILTDSHQAWPHGGACADTCPWIVTADLVNNNQGGVLTPSWPSNMVFAVPVTNPPNPCVNSGGTCTFLGGPTFGHTFSCGATGHAVCASGPDAFFSANNAIGNASQDGKFFALTSTMLNSLGLDAHSTLRMDAFVITLQ